MAWIWISACGKPIDVQFRLSMYSFSLWWTWHAVLITRGRGSMFVQVVKTEHDLDIDFSGCPHPIDVQCPLYIYSIFSMVKMARC
jgi:hypothetical protein